MTIRTVHTEADVSELVSDILTTTRDHVTCVISLPLGHDGPLFDPHEVQLQSAGFCDVWVIPTGDLTRLLTQQLPNNADCYGGAARVYPISTEWISRPKLSKRIMAPALENVGVAMDALITEIHAQAFLSGLMARRATLTRAASGVVTGFISDGARAFVKLDDGRPSAIARELTVPEVSLSNILNVGQRVNGMLDEELNRLMLDVPTVTEAQILAHFGAGTVTLGVVTEVSRQFGLVSLYPGLSVRLEQRDVSSNKKDLVDVLYAVGDVIRVRVVRTPQGRLSVRTIDIDDDEDVAPAFVVIGGGPEWLSEDRLHWLPTEEQVTESIESFLSRIGLERDHHSDDLVGAGNSMSPTTAAVPTPGPGPRPALTTGPIALPGKTVLESQNLRILELKARVTELERDLARANPRGMKAVQDQMRLEISELFGDRDTLRAQLKAEKERTTELRSQLREARAKQVVGNDYTASRSWFSLDTAGAEEWVRHEVNHAWIERIPAAERASRPLTEFILGPDFIDTLTTFTNGQKYKAFKCIVDVLVGTPEMLALRQVHALRASDGANAPDRVREDGAVAMRAYIEEGVASARRLHYWKHTDGTIELATAAVHDQMAA